MTKPTIKEIVKMWVIAHGYQGLYNGDCGCAMEELMWCGTPGEACLPGYRSRCKGCEDHEFCIVPEKDSKCPQMKGEIVTDIDGNVYRTMKIGNQLWMAENLKATHYRNGEPIPNVISSSEWGNLSTGACCVYDNKESNVSTYGRLYNWYAVNDSRNIAPTGWHVPSDAEFQILVDHLGGNKVAGGKMKEGGIAHWQSPNTDANNESGFSALPGGFRSNYDGYFLSMGSTADFWSSTEYGSGYAWGRGLNYYSSEVYRYNYHKEYGYSVRCIKD